MLVLTDAPLLLQAAGWLGITDPAAELHDASAAAEPTASARFSKHQAGLGYIESKHKVGFDGVG